MNIDIKNLEKANPCWKCWKDPIIEISKQKIILKCPNEECNNKIVLTDYPSIEDGFKVWNEVFNCKRIIPKNVHYLNTCDKCINKLNCIFARSLNNIHLMSITCDEFKRDPNVENQIKIKEYIESIYPKIKNKNEIWHFI